MWSRQRLVLWLAVPLGATVAGACGADEEGPQADSAHPIHVHGLGVNPRDGALFIAAHSGLFRSPSESSSAEPVGPSQDTMGFTVVGPDRFLASGHPTPGASWEPRSAP